MANKKTSNTQLIAGPRVLGSIALNTEYFKAKGLDIVNHGDTIKHIECSNIKLLNNSNVIVYAHGYNL